MSQTQLPAKIDEKDKELQVEVSIPDRTVTESQAIEAMKRRGLVLVDDHYLEDLETIGIYSRTGCLKIQRGKAMINQHKLEQAIATVTEKLVTAKIREGKKTAYKDGVLTLPPKEYAALGQTLAQLSKALTDSQRFSVEMDQTYRPAATVKDEDQVQTSFIPGAPVTPHIVAQHVTINPPAPAPAQEKG
jgi:hypothetical protein